MHTTLPQVLTCTLLCIYIFLYNCRRLFTSCTLLGNLTRLQNITVLLIFRLLVTRICIDHFYDDILNCHASDSIVISTMCVLQIFVSYRNTLQSDVNNLSKEHIQSRICKFCDVSHEMLLVFFYQFFCKSIYNHCVTFLGLLIWKCYQSSIVGVSDVIFYAPLSFFGGLFIR